MLIVALSLSLASALVFAVAPRAAEFTPDQEQTFDIGARPLDQALSVYARVSGVDILYVQGLTAGRTSNPISGRYTAAAALQALLHGAGLTARFTGRKAAIIYVVGTAPPPPSPSRGALPTLHLDMAEVRAPVVIGGDRSAFDAYAMSIQGEIRRLLERDPTVKSASFHAALAMRIDPMGQIETVTLLQGSGDRARDDHIRTALAGGRLSKPPSGLTRPIEFEIEWSPALAQN